MTRSVIPTWLDIGGVARVTGGSFPARIWQAFMGPAHQALAAEDFPAPPEPAVGTFLRLLGERRPRPRDSKSTSTTVLFGPPRKDDRSPGGHGRR